MTNTLTANLDWIGKRRIDGFNPIDISNKKIRLGLAKTDFFVAKGGVEPPTSGV